MKTFEAFYKDLNAAGNMRLRITSGNLVEVEPCQPTERAFKRIRAGLKLRHAIDRLYRKYPRYR